MWVKLTWIIYCGCDFQQLFEEAISSGSTKYDCRPLSLLCQLRNKLPQITSTLFD